LDLCIQISLFNKSNTGAFRCADGVVVIAARKKKSKFLVKPHQKIFKINENILIAATGLLFDANAIIDVAKKISMQYRNMYCDEIPVESLCEELSTIMHKQVRPLNIGIFIHVYIHMYIYLHIHLGINFFM
jgi:20S proteasome alpha/beta subunit